MIPASVLSKLARLDLSDEQADAVAALLCEVEAATEAKAGAAIAARRAADRERKQRQRASEASTVSRDVTGHPQTSEDKRGETLSPKERFHTSKETTPNPVSSLRSETNARTREAAIDREFDEVFWPAYPHKVGKPDARKAYHRCRKANGLDEIMAGMREYIRNKPSDRSWLNPATFLNQERFNDRPAAVEARAGPANGKLSYGDIARMLPLDGTHERPDDHDAFTSPGPANQGLRRLVG